MSSPAISGSVDYAILNTPNLYSYWKLDETSGTTAFDSYGSNSGIYQGSPILGANSLISGTGVILNGTSNYITTSQVLNFGKVTIEAFIYVSGYPSANSLIAGFSNGVNGGAWDKDLYIGTDGKINWYMYDGGTKSIASPSPIATNVWQHIVATADGNIQKIFIDGFLVASGSLAGLAFQGYTVPNFFIGHGAQVASAGYFKGKIDSVALYNDAISDSSVFNHYASTTNPNNLLRSSQSPLEAAYTPSGNLLRLSQTVIETPYAAQYNLLRASQLPIEVLYTVYNSGVYASVATSASTAVATSANGIYTLTGSIGSGTSGASGTTHDVNAVLGVIYKGAAPVSYDVTTTFDATAVQSNNSGVLDPSSSGVSYIIDPNSSPHMIHIIYEDVIITRDPYVENTNFDYLNRRYTSPKYYKKRGF